MTTISTKPTSTKPTSLHLPRPRSAIGPYLRIASINDVYDITSYPYVETVIQALKQTADDAVVVATLSGDFLSPCLISSLDGGKAMLDILKVVDIDYLCFGNHEFDIQLEVLCERFKNYSGKCLNSNIANLPIIDANGQLLPQYDVIEVGRHRVAFGGFCTNNMESFRPGINLMLQPIFEALQETWSKCIEDYPSLQIVSINHAPFDPQQMYNLDIYQFLLTGMNDIKPLQDYVNQSGGAPPVEQCLPAKNLILESCMKDAWRTLVHFDEWDANGDGQVSKAELEVAIKKAFVFLDHNQDGYISPNELQAALTKHTGRTQKGLISMMFETLDADRDGQVSMAELASLVI